MTKIIIKEAGIVILLLISIVLILGIVFYEYIPISKTVPIKKEAYALPEDIKEELNESVIEGQNIIRTYYIDSTDLDAYESSNEYDKGKANPFGDYTTRESGISNNDNSNNTQSQNNTSQENTNNSEVYFNTPGKNY